MRRPRYVCPYCYRTITTCYRLRHELAFHPEELRKSLETGSNAGGGE